MEYVIESGIEVWKSFVLEIERKIISGEYLPGQKLPSLRTLKEEYNLSLWTIQKGLEYLAKKEVLVMKPGRGYYVRPYVQTRLFNEHKERLQKVVTDACVAAQSIGIKPEELLAPYNRMVGSDKE